MCSGPLLRLHLRRRLRPHRPSRVHPCAAKRQSPRRNRQRSRPPRPARPRRSLGPLPRRRRAALLRRARLRAAASAASLSGYIAEVSAEIRRRLFYPDAARARGAKGVVGVAFSIGPSGAVTSFAITRSSGDHDLDAAARSLVPSASWSLRPGRNELQLCPPLARSSLSIGMRASLTSCSLEARRV